MSKLPKDIEKGDVALYPIRMVSDLADVNAITLRAWERRYGLFEPVRKASGHRLYTVKVHDRLGRYGANVLGTDLNKGLARLRDIIPEDLSGVGENAANVSNY